MKQAGEYRKNATECRRLAAYALKPEEREQLLTMASTWEVMAQQREQMLARHPELIRQADEVAGRLENMIEKGDKGSGT